MPLKRFPLDAAIVFADIMSPMPALGIEFDFDPGPVVANPIRDGARARAAARSRARRDRARGHRGAEAHARGAARVDRAARLLRRAVDARGVSRRGQGHEGLPDAARVRRRRAAAARSRCSRGSRTCRSTTCARQAAAGADAVQIFDSWAGLLSRASWEKLIRPHLHDAARGRGPLGDPADPVPAERAAPRRRVREPAGRGARRRLARGPRATCSAATRTAPCRATSIPRS